MALDVATDDALPDNGMFVMMLPDDNVLDRTEAFSGIAFVILFVAFVLAETVAEIGILVTIFADADVLEDAVAVRGIEVITSEFADDFADTELLNNT